ncbi:uncharacterized protein LOC121053197 [Oryza brachyantha]|uniref:uncharacterized protein LOC121053197 n=1 Tax=Oryza brachyantha TaxID=4533 RepID=UPI0007764B07|nr:uncharacterized protein LOC121053197 [Oryza brachyantha]
MDRTWIQGRQFTSAYMEGVKQFMKFDGQNLYLMVNSKKSVTPTEAALQDELTAERQSSVILHEEVLTLKEQANLANEALAKTQKELGEFKQQQEENNMLLRRILSLSQVNICARFCETCKIWFSVKLVFVLQCLLGLFVLCCEVLIVSLCDES